MWNKESSLNSCGHVYFLKPVDGAMHAGTDRGVFVLNGDATWTPDPTFPQTTFDVLQGTWGGQPFTAWGKDDGLAFTLQKSTGGFTSDHYDPLDGKKVYGLFYGQWQTVMQDADGGNSKIVKHDGLYLCTEAGLFGLASGSRGGQYSALLKGREMFGAYPLTVTAGLPDGSSATVPVKIYQIFQSLRPKSVPLVILTTNGIYVVRNWRWCDPTMPSSPPADDGTGGNLDFIPEAHSLSGLSCTCSAQTTGTGAGGETLYKMFVGTSQGVYRSHNEGYTWERCERIAGGAAVYSLASNGTCLFAGTDQGLFYSGNDGDDWQLPTTDGNSCANFSGNVSAAIPFSGSYLAQSFRTGQTALTKVSLYLERSTLVDGDPSLGNTLQASVWLCDGNGYPTSVVATASDLIRASDVTYPGFHSAFLPVSGLDTSRQYALVVRETVATNGVPCVSWLRSSLSNPYLDGVRMSGSPGAWAQVAAEDFFFRVYEQAPVAPVATTVDAGFSQGLGAGVLVADDGSLTTDFKFAATVVVDDTNSLAWSDPASSPTQAHPAQLTTLLDLLWAYTTPGVGGQPYPLSRADFWVFSTDLVERTSGFTSNLTTLETAAGALFERGLVSSLYDTAQIAISGLGPQAIIDSIIQKDDLVGNYSRVSALISYLSGRGLLRLTDIQAWYALMPQPNSGWDGQASTIAAIDDVANFVSKRWANSYTPVALILADGDEDGFAAVTDVAQTAQTAWGGVGAPVYSFGLGRSHEEGGLRTISALSGGRHIDVTNPASGGDWDAARASFLPGGANTLFRATWSRSFDFAELSWIRSVNATFTAPSGTCSCTVEYRVTRDRLHWLAWTTVVSGTPSAIGDLVLGLQYRVTLTDDWSGSAPIRPSLTALGHVIVAPSFQYLITPPQAIPQGAVAEYILSAAADVPSTARLTWGIVRGDSTDFADFEPVLNNRKAALANRQQSVQFTDPVVRALLSCTSQDNRVYQVIGTDGLPARWTTSDQVDVYTSGFLVDPSRAAYALDGTRGLVYFANTQPPTLSVKVTITTPARMYVSSGEPTSTRDNRTYSLSHGRWPADAQVVVLVNGAIKRGGYFINPEEGTVTFKSEHQPTDIVTVFVETAPLYRAGVEIRNYGISSVVLKNFGLEFSLQQNASLVARSRLSPQPSIVPGSLKVSPSGATIFNRLSVDYQFLSQEGNEEHGTQVSWFKNGSRVTAYDNRTVERTVDVGAGGLFAPGDVVYIQVSPSDGLTTGQTAQSPSVTLRGVHAPFVSSPVIVGASQGVSPDTNLYAPAGSTLVASYTFTSPDGGSDHSSVNWYLRDATHPFYTGGTIPFHMTKSGQVVNYIVTPNAGDGNPGVNATSDYVTIR